MRHTPRLQQLIDALRYLPGVGQKSAQRMAFHLLHQARDAAQELNTAITDALDHIRPCRQCRMFAEAELCEFCASERRDGSLLCVVEGPADVMAIEQSGGYNGRYFVLMGHLSPLDGIGPDALGLSQLDDWLQKGEVRELIVATNSTVEGEATAHYLAEMGRARNIGVSRIAHGIPMGGELEYVDSGTLSHALTGRKLL
ncbi:MAG: recombination mediator RecR [Nevskiales bacterium]